MITVISRISQWNILMPTKVHDAHGLYRQCNAENDSSQNYIVISLRFLFSLPYIKKISILTCLVHYFTTWMFFRCISTHYFHTIVYSTLTALVNCAWKVIIHARWSKNLHSMNALHVYCYFIRLSQPLCRLLKMWNTVAFKKWLIHVS